MLLPMQNFPVCIPSPPHYWFLHYIVFLFLFSKSVTVRTDTKSNHTIRKPWTLPSYSDGWWITSQPPVLFIVMKSSPDLCFLISKDLLWKNYTAEGNTCLGMLWHRVRAQTVTSHWPKCFCISHLDIYMLFNTFSFMCKPLTIFFSEVYRAKDTILKVPFHWTSHGCTQENQLVQRPLSHCH